MMEKEKSGIKIRIVIIAGCLIILSALSAFIVNFYKYPISDDISNWGALGDYMSPFLEFVNIIAVLYLTYHVSKFDNKRNKENIRTQKIIVLTEMRLQVVKELNETIDNNGMLESFGVLIPEMKNKLFNFRTQLIFFPMTYGELFKGLFTKQFEENCFVPVSESTDDFIKLYKEENLDPSKINTVSSIFFQDKIFFINHLNKFIIDQMDK